MGIFVYSDMGKLEFSELCASPSKIFYSLLLAKNIFKKRLILSTLILFSNSNIENARFESNTFHSFWVHTITKLCLSLFKLTAYLIYIYLIRDKLVLAYKIVPCNWSVSIKPISCLSFMHFIYLPTSIK